MPTITVKNHDFRRADTILSGGARWPWNLQDESGVYHAFSAPSGNILYQRSESAAPPFVAGVSVTSTGHDTEPKGIRVHDGSLLVVFTRDAGGGSSDVYSSTSLGDDGQTWSAPTVAFAGGKHGTIATENPPAGPGAIVRAAYVGGVIQGNFQDPGDAAPGANFTFLDTTGAALAVEDDGFHIQSAAEGPARWLLHVSILGEGATSHWASGDGCRSWARVS